MQAYWPHDPVLLKLLFCIGGLQVLFGYALARLVPRGIARWIAWLGTVGAVVAVAYTFADEPSGLRMLAFMVVAMLGLKVVVLVEERTREEHTLEPRPWLAFALGWPGMRPHLFAQLLGPAVHGAGRLARMGAAYFVAGVVLLGSSRAWWNVAHEPWSATAIFFVGASLTVHFGVFDLLAALWRSVGVACEELFRAPWLAQSLSEFWSRRWNLAFSEMTAIAVYRPLSGKVGRGWALMASFLVSGLLHEMAISLPVKAGYGLPTAYFALHGMLVWVERELTRRGRPIQGLGGRVWTLGWLVVPLPILFHRAFLDGVVWPLIGIR
jgi:alginate O-acetyltransferase complex protein AlgI